MTITSSQPASTFGHIYQHALQLQLEIIGKHLAELRRSRRKDVETVANALNIRPGVLLRIENGQQDFRLKTLFALCDYYNADLESIIDQGKLMWFKLV